jgi:hypothetical protein
MRFNMHIIATESAAQFTKSSTMAQHFKLTVKDRRRQSDGLKWESIKIPQWNLGYIPKSIRHVSWLTRSRSHSYRQAIVLQNRVRKTETQWKHNKTQVKPWVKPTMIKIKPIDFSLSHPYFIEQLVNAFKKINIRAQRALEKLELFNPTDQEYDRSEHLQQESKHQNHWVKSDKNQDPPGRKTNSKTSTKRSAQTTSSTKIWAEHGEINQLTMAKNL